MKKHFVDWFELNMNIVVLLAGKGSRFMSFSDQPKPMIEVEGKSILERTLDSLPFLKDWNPDQLWFVVLKEHVERFDIDQWLVDLYGDLIHIIEIPEVPGHLKTATAATDHILRVRPHAMDHPLLILDGDNAYDGSKVFEGFHQHFDRADDHAIIYYFNQQNPDPHWCFAMMNGDRVWDLQEKNPHASFCGGKPMVGAFFFSNLFRFKYAAEAVLKSSTKVGNEFYVSQAVKWMVDGGWSVFGQEVSSVVPLGTPKDVEKFSASTSKWNKRQLILCLDIDDTICDTKKPGEEYGHEPLQPGALAVLRKWKAAGHYIILQTARHMKTCEGNVGKVMARQGITLLQWLKDNEVPYDELWWSKPHADLFIDDKGLRHTPGDWSATEAAVENFLKEHA